MKYLEKAFWCCGIISAIVITVSTVTSQRKMTKDYEATCKRL